MRLLAALLPVLLLVPACPSAPPTDPEQPSGNGWLVIAIRDGASGEPVTDAHYYGMKFAGEEHLVASRPPLEVDFFKTFHSEDGLYRWELKPGWHQLRIEAGEYWRSWTPAFRIASGEETKLTFDMHRNILLRVKVFDVDGSPLRKGVVGVSMGMLRGSVAIADGIGELWVEDDEVTLDVGKIWLEEYREQSIQLALTPGEVNEVTIHLTR